MKINIQLDEQELEIVARGVAELPYKQSAPVMALLEQAFQRATNEQRTAQAAEKAAAAAAEAAAANQYEAKED